MLGGLLRAASVASSPAFHFGDTIRLYSWEVVAHDFGLTTVDRFPQFSAIAKKRLFICIQMMPKTAEIDQGWPSFRASLTRSRSCTIRNSRQSTLDLLNSCRKRKTADARPWVKYMLGRAIRLWFSGATVSLRPFRRHLRVWVGQS